MCTAFKYEVFYLIVVAIILFASFAGLRHAQIPIVANTCSFTKQGTSILVGLSETTTATSCVKTDIELDIIVSFPIYVIAICTFVGWFILILFLGSGLIALPFDYINAWRFRPIPMKEDEFERAKSELARKVQVLLQ